MSEHVDVAKAIESWFVSNWTAGQLAWGNVGNDLEKQDEPYSEITVKFGRGGRSDAGRGSGGALFRQDGTVFIVLCSREGTANYHEANGMAAIATFMAAEVLSGLVLDEVRPFPVMRTGGWQKVPFGVNFHFHFTK